MLRLQTGFSDGSNSPTNIGGSNAGVDWVPFYIEETEGKEESEKHNSSSDEESCTEFELQSTSSKITLHILRIP